MFFSPRNAKLSTDSINRLYIENNGEFCKMLTSIYTRLDKNGNQNTDENYKTYINMVKLGLNS